MLLRYPTTCHSWILSLVCTSKIIKFNVESIYCLVEIDFHQIKYYCLGGLSMRSLILKSICVNFFPLPIDLIILF